MSFYRYYTLRRAEAIAIDATSVYWTDYLMGTVNKVPIDGGPTTTLATELGNGSSIALDATSIYWTDVSLGQVMKLAK